jgi:hypothetical protein
MKTLKEKLNNPFDGLKGNPQEFQKKCAEIANELFKNYCIECGEKKFALAEIEFYYFKEGEFKEKWNEKTYERNPYDSSKLFYHLSGVDICFKSELTKDKKGNKHGYGGGVLIRSMVEVNENGEYLVDSDKYYKIIIGPLTCVNMMLNACNGNSMPKIEPIIISKRQNFTPKETYRYLGKNDFELIENEEKQKEKRETNIDGSLKLAFYNPFGKKEEEIEKIWNHARSSYYSKRLEPNRDNKTNDNQTSKSKL